MRFFFEAYRQRLIERFAASTTGTLRVACIPDVLRSNVLSDFPEPERVRALKLDLARLRSVVWYGQGTRRPDIPLDHYPRVKAVVSRHWADIPNW